jgi:outer membrane protein
VKKIISIILIVVFLYTNIIAYCQDDELVTVSLSQCLNLGLTRNLDIKIARIEALIVGQDVTLAESIFDTIISGNINYSDDQLAVPNIILGEKTLEANYDAGIAKKFFTGTELNIDYSDQRTWTDSPFAVSNPLHTADLSFTLKQPISRNFFGYIDRATVKISRIEYNIADIKAKGRIEDAVADIEKAYWRLVFAYENLALTRELFEQAEKLYNIYAEHLKTGFVEETDVYETEANMRIRKTDLFIAENNVITASNNLKLLLNEDGDFIVKPKDALSALLGKVDLIESLNQAFYANREYRMKKKELETDNITIKMKENNLWPEIDLVGTLAVNGVDRKFTKANRLLTTTKHPYYYGGIEVSMPLENRKARGEYQKAILEKDKSLIELIQIEKRIFTSIDEGVRNVNLHYENSERWKKIKEIQYAKLIEESKKLKYGRSTSKIVIDYQNDFTRAAISELASVLRYYVALIDLENEKDTLLDQVGVFEQ